MSREVLPGQRFGSLVVVERSANKRHWVVQCDCGNICNARGTRLLCGQTRSCGCKRGTRCIDLTGKRFGRLTVIQRAERNRGRLVAWIVRCDCGAIKEIVGADMKWGDTRSCGCLKKQNLSALGKRTAVANARKGAAKAAKTRTRHGMHKSSIYSVWEAMNGRCRNKANRKYRDYGGRGIRVCERWRTFENFYADMGERPEGKTLERVDNNGDYCQENCRWATVSEQNCNKRSRQTIKTDRAAYERSMNNVA